MGYNSGLQAWPFYNLHYSEAALHPPSQCYHSMYDLANHSLSDGSEKHKPKKHFLLFSLFSNHTDHVLLFKTH